jgi:hypothetical protein
MKTIREWLEELPEPYRMQAFNNATSDLDIQVVSLSLALMKSFIFNASKEGCEYWVKISEYINNNTLTMQQETKYKPFDLERALKGEKVITRNGRRVMEIYHFKYDISEWCVGVVLEGGNYLAYCKDGTIMRPFSPASDDLFMAPVKREVWVNVYRNVTGNYYISGKTFKSSSEALEERFPVEDYVKSIKIHEYEE